MRDIFKGGKSERPRSLLLSGGCHPDPRLGLILGPSRSRPGSEGVPSRFTMCFVLQHFGPIQVPRWGPSRPVPVPSWSRVFLPGSGLDGPKQTSWPLPRKTHPNKNNLRKQFSGLFVQTVRPLSFKLNKRHAERAWVNCLRKLFSVGFIGVGD